LPAGEPDALAHARPVAADVEASHRRRASVGCQQRREDPDGRGLARAVRAEETEDGPSLDAEVDANEGDDFAVLLA
jgi:hypothetical protein